MRDRFCSIGTVAVLSCFVTAFLIVQGFNSSSEARAKRVRKSRKKAIEKMYDKRTGITWIKIKGGSFKMGTDSGKWNNAKPVHHVRVKDFWIAKTEVTVAQYRRCVRAGRCSKPQVSRQIRGKYTRGYRKGKQCNWRRSGRSRYPVNCVTWNQAKTFSKWAGGRLPSEAEWEYAAKSRGKPWKYPWGNSKATCSKAILRMSIRKKSGCGRKRSWRVCSKRRGNTRQGLCDMAGNVWEWVQDNYHKTYNGAPTDGSAWVDSGSKRVLRGGSWGDIVKYGSGRTTRRTGFPPDNEYSILGFRPAK